MDRWNREGGVKHRQDLQENSDDGDHHEPQEPTVFYPRSIHPSLEHPDKRPIRALMPNRKPRCASDILPHLPKRPPGGAPPIINRELKPGRMSKTTEQTTPIINLNQMVTKIPPRPVKLPSQNTFEQGDNGPPARSPPSAPCQRIPTHWSKMTSTQEEMVSTSRLTGLRSGSSYRRSLDLESEELNRRLVTNDISFQDLKVKHHEWPQVKGDAVQNDYTGQNKPAEASGEQDWYVGAFSRVEAEHGLHLVNREGAFLVRNCSRNTTNEPFVLAIFYDNRVFNIQIRYCTETCKYSLGTRLKTDDKFNSVAEIIKFHSIFPIMLIDGRNSTPVSNIKRNCILMYPVTKNDMDQLLNKFT